MRDSERQQVFDGWTQEHRGLLLKIVRTYAFSPEDQDDLFQEISIQLWRSVPNHRGESAETTWIYRVALYTALGWTRKERPHRVDHVSLEEVGPALRAIPEHQDDRLDWLYGRIAELHEADRSLMLLLLEGFSYRDMAEIVGISESNVGAKISRIKRRFSLLATKETNET
jgi:RNA polymerase sigma-70 factor, ECF subfamily